MQNCFFQSRNFNLQNVGNTGVKKHYNFKNISYYVDEIITIMALDLKEIK